MSHYVASFLPILLPIHSEYSILTLIHGYCGTQCGNLANVKVNYVHYSPYVHKSSCFIIEANRPGQGWFRFCKFMLTVLNYLLLHAARNVFQKDLIHGFPKDRRKDDPLSFLVFWTILKMRVTFAFVQIPVTYPSFLDLSEIVVISLALDAPHQVLWTCMEQSVPRNP